MLDEGAQQQLVNLARWEVAAMNAQTPEESDAAIERATECDAATPREVQTRVPR
jgi:hypothetical protein